MHWCYDVSSDLGQIYPEADEIAILRNAKIVGLSPKIELNLEGFHDSFIIALGYPMQHFRNVYMKQMRWHEKE